MKTRLQILIGALVLTLGNNTRAQEPLGASATNPPTKSGEDVAQNASPVGTANPANWKLVWSDEFDYTGLPDPRKWGYEEGFVRNKEPQYYTRGRLENARVENGALIIEARKETFKNPHFNSGNPKMGIQPEFAEYTSASLTTKNLASWRFGRMEIRAKLPQGAGQWPAFWMLGIDHDSTGWPGCGEIDIMEYWARQPHEMTSTVHWRKDGKHQQDSGKLNVPSSLGDFHVYALEWDDEKMDFFCDGKKYHTVPLSELEDKGGNAFRKPFYILLNLAIEGRGRKVDDSVFPRQFVVKYVRVYEPKP